MHDRTDTPRPARAKTSRALLVILGVAVVGSTLAIAKRPNDYEFFDPMIEVKSIIERFAAQEPDLQELQDAAIAGMVEALDDPYAVYVPPQYNEEFEKELTGEYVGIGAEVNTIDGVFTIVTPMDDSPAFRAGVMAGDKVIEIDGEPTEGKPIDDNIDLLLGEEGTDVTILVEREGGERTEITITRAQIKARSVRGFRRQDDAEATWDYMLDPDRKIGYIRVSQFTPNLYDEFTAALAEIGAPSGELGGLVIDLRWNPGGLLDQAIRLADLFLEDGVIVSTNGRAYEERVVRASERGTLPFFPVAVVVNGQSASASEVLAGALVENDRAIVVGERTFGKGSVQSVHPLGGAASGASLKLTEQRYFLPSGRSLQRSDESPAWGVDPSPGYLVPVEGEALVDLVRVRREAEILQRAAASEAIDQSDPAWIEDTLKDPQLAEAVRAVQHHIAEGEWPAKADSELEAGQTFSALELQRLDRARRRLLRDLARLDRRADALAAAAGDEAVERDFWDDSIDLAGGEIVVRDGEGNEVTRLLITGPNLERWLLDADVDLPEAPDAGDEGDGDAGGDE